LERQAEVGVATASLFFRKMMNNDAGHGIYTRLCGDRTELVRLLRGLNNENVRDRLFGRNPPNEESGRGGEE
jgi:hypothetical protein